jgi:hypothetical protein
MILKSVCHVRTASAQRRYLKTAIARARADLINNIRHEDRHYCLIGDYAQNLGLPFLGQDQPGETYYWVPYYVYIFGLVNCAHLYPDGVTAEGNIGDHMQAYVYHEKEASKDGNTVASLVMKSLFGMNIIIPGRKGGKLSIFFDNCPGQNKNNTVLKLVPYLVECGYFSVVEIVFLIVGHTKNSCDRIFNNLKGTYRNSTVYTFTQLIDVLDESFKVTVTATYASDFKKWGEHLKQFYSNMANKIENWHIFTVNEKDITTSNAGHKQVVVRIREADIIDAKTIEHRIKKRGPFNDLLPNSVEPEPLIPIAPNPYKVVEFFRKWAKVVPQQYHPEICQEPTKEQWAHVKKEAEMRDVVKKVKRKQRNEKLDEIEDKLMKETLPSKESGNDSDSEDDINLATLAQMKKQKVLHKTDDYSSEEEDIDEDINLEELAKLKKRRKQRND